MRLTTVLTISLLLWGIAATRTLAQEQPAPGVALPEGAQLLDLAWADDSQLILLLKQGKLLNLSRLVLAEGKLEPLALPQAVSQALSDTDNRTKVYLSPSGNALAILHDSGSPVKAAEFSAYLIDGDQLNGINTRTIPRDFWIDNVSWDSLGQDIYLVPRPYLFPEQTYSIGRLNLRTGTFAGVALKGNLGLVEDLVYLPNRAALAAKCLSFHGQYPAAAVMVLLEPGAREVILHSQAGSLSLHSLADGRLLAFDPAGDEQWVLEPGSQVLRRAKISLKRAVETLATSSDGAWLGFLTDGEGLGRSFPSGEQRLALQCTADGRMLISATSCSRFSFAPGGRMVCAVSGDGRGLYFYQLPAAAAPAAAIP